jgi:hypothetical protein
MHDIGKMVPLGWTNGKMLPLGWTNGKMFKMSTGKR